MKRVFKYSLMLADSQQVKLPAGARVLSVMTQRNDIVVYALVDPEREEQKNWDVYTFYVVGTGNAFAHEQATFLGTVSIAHGSLVFHVFYEKH